MYMQVESRTGTLLHLKRNPSIRSWSLLVGILSVGLAAAYYSTDTWLWKLFYVAGCAFVALQNLEDWEDAIFDKKSGKAILTTYSIYKKLLTLLVVLLKEIRDVNVEEERVRYFGKGYVIVLRFVTGISHPLTQSAVLGTRSDVEAVAKELTKFLEFDLVGSQSQAVEESSDSESDGALDKQYMPAAGV
ncbi:hypothetical protein XELAEV_18046760mg [Xenopus laevis]|uniref:Essential for reactive oxygen species protein n=1 Tax=Xenopus laevis TaxID=8355 RepID=A0A974H0W6_XENLA|nr:hypothetical protein XELAEV_18046760mg [Xenopus laevis]